MLSFWVGATLFYLCVLVFFSTPLWFPVCLLVSRKLRSADKRRSDWMAVSLLFVPGLLVTLSCLFIDTTMFDNPMTRASFFNELLCRPVHVGFDIICLVLPFLETLDRPPAPRLRGAQFDFVVFWFVTLVALVVWVLCEWRAARRATSGKAPSRYPNLLLGASVTVLLVVTGGLAQYLANYETLSYAVGRGDLELARKRLEFNLLGVDVDTGDVGLLSSGTVTKPLRPSIADPEMAKLLVEYGADGGDTSSGMSPLEWAVFEGEAAEVKALVDGGANPGEGIAMAARLNRTAILQFLLERGGDPSLGVGAATRGSAVECLRLLLERGGDPDSSGYRTPIQEAAYRCCRECVRLLIEHGADLTVRRNIEHGTLLHLVATSPFGYSFYASWRDDKRTEDMLATARLLVEHGCDLTITERGGRTPLDYAESRKNAPLADYLRSVMPEQAEVADEDEGP